VKPNRHHAGRIVAVIPQTAKAGFGVLEKVFRTCKTLSEDEADVIEDRRIRDN
jgi:hypothetical protein